MKMEDILNNLIGDDVEKTASAAPVELTEEQVLEKVAYDLSDEDIVNLEKIAEELETEKTAEEAIAYGRLMARGFWEESEKIASDNVPAGSMNSVSGTEGSEEIAKGKGTAMSEGGNVAEQASKDSSATLAKVQSSLNSIQQPDSPNKSQDAYEVVKKIIDTAKAVKQQPAEMPNNG
jgi:hypothetical protein